jgi:Spy/CpxP family protein refolding chaperone
MNTKSNLVRRMTTPLSLGMILVLAPVLTIAQPAERGAPLPGKGRHMERMIEALDLTPSQETAVRDLFTEHHEAMWDGRDQMREARRALHDQIQAEELDEVALREAAAAIAALEADRAVERARLHQQLRGILTPDQLEELQEMHRGRRGRFGDCMEGGYGPHGPHGRHGRHGYGPGPRRGGTF